MFCYTKDGKIIAIDVKTYAKRMNWMDTGINYEHYLVYRAIQEVGIKVWLFFVDHIVDAVYGQALDELVKYRPTADGCWPKKDYPRKEGGKFYFPLAAMKTIISPLPGELREELETLTRGRRGTQSDLPGLIVADALHGRKNRRIVSSTKVEAPEEA